MTRLPLSRLVAVTSGAWRTATSNGSQHLISARHNAPVVKLPARRMLSSSFRAFAQGDSSAPTIANPSSTAALTHLEAGNVKLEKGDVEAAMKAYEQSVEAEETGAGWYNLGVTQYHLKDIPKAIMSWTKAIELAPSTDAHMSTYARVDPGYSTREHNRRGDIASAYVFSKPSQPALAIQHLKKALELAPEDPEIAFNLAAILESTNNLQPALQLYQKAAKGGIERAEQNVRSVAAKIAQALDASPTTKTQDGQ